MVETYGQNFLNPMKVEDDVLGQILFIVERCNYLWRTGASLRGSINYDFPGFFLVHLHKSKIATFQISLVIQLQIEEHTSDYIVSETDIARFWEDA